MFLRTVADLAESAGCWLSWTFGSISTNAVRSEFSANEVVHGGASRVGATGCVVFCDASGNMSDAQVRVISPGVALLRFAGIACENGACPAGTTLRSVGHPVPFDTGLGGYLVGCRDPCTLRDALTGRDTAVYPPGSALRRNAIASSHQRRAVLEAV